VYQSLGHCPRGVTCRWGGAHLDSRGRNLKNQEVFTGTPTRYCLVIGYAQSAPYGTGTVLKAVFRIRDILVRIRIRFGISDPMFA
jgi:hypothetical protein